MVVIDLPFARSASPFETILILAAAAEFCRFPILLARSQARRAFGLDQRPFGVRFGRLASREFLGFSAVVALTYGLLSFLGRIGLVPWAIILFVVVQAVVWLPVIFQRLEPRLFPKRFREIAPGETPDNLPRILQSLPLPKDWAIKKILVYLGRGPIPPWPAFVGPTLVVPQKALEMPMGALRHRVVTAVLGRLVKAEGLIVILKALTMSLTVPLTLVFLGSLGVLWRVSQEFSPVLIPCLWLAAGLSDFLSRSMIRFVRRLLERKLSAAAVLATWDVPGFQASLDVASRADLEPNGNPWWFWFSRTRPGAIEQLEQVKEQLQSISKSHGHAHAKEAAGKPAAKKNRPLGDNGQGRDRDRVNA
jgi:hypothetical protein